MTMTDLLNEIKYKIIKKSKHDATYPHIHKQTYATVKVVTWRHCRWFMMFKSADIIVVIIERVTLTDHYGQYKRSLIHKKLGILELVANDDIGKFFHYDPMSSLFFLGQVKVFMHTPSNMTVILHPIFYGFL